MSCGVGLRHGSDLVLLWLWRRLAATAPIRPLAWEPPYAVGAALKRQERKEKKRKERERERKEGRKGKERKGKEGRKEGRERKGKEGRKGKERKGRKEGRKCYISLIN